MDCKSNTSQQFDVAAKKKINAMLEKIHIYWMCSSSLDNWLSRYFKLNSYTKLVVGFSGLKLTLCSNMILKEPV